MVRVELSGKAQDDLASIHRYIARLGYTPNPVIAGRTIARILDAIELLSSFPSAGKPGRVQGTWELTISTVPYFVVYRQLGENHLVVTAIIHNRRQYPPDDIG